MKYFCEQLLRDSRGRVIGGEHGVVYEGTAFDPVTYPGRECFECQQKRLAREARERKAS